MKSVFYIGLGFLCLAAPQAQARSYRAARPLMGIEVLKAKHRSSWTEVTVAVENKSDKVLSLDCCKAYLENSAGFAVTSLTNDEIKRQVYNHMGAGATIGQLIGVGLGIGGLASGNDTLAYTGLGVGLGSTVAGVAGDASANSQKRGIVMDNVFRNQTFPPHVKIAGTVYFPPRKKWPNSKEAANLHVIYREDEDADEQDVTIPFTESTR